MATEFRVGIFVYDDVEPIDLGATFGTLSMARRLVQDIGIYCVAAEAGPIMLTNGLEVVAPYGFETLPDVDALIVSGGPGWAAQVKDDAVLNFLRRKKDEAPIVSVCTGAMILAAAGLLDGRPATTKAGSAAGEALPLDLLRDASPEVNVIRACVVDDGDIVTGGGVTLAIDTTLYLLRRFLGADVAEVTARSMSYEAAWLANEDAYGTRITGETVRG